MNGANRPLETGWLPDTPVADTVLRRFLHNQIEFNEHVAVARSGQVQRTAEVSLVQTGPVTAFLNQAVLRRPLAGAGDPALDEIESFYRHECVLLSLWPTPDLAGRGWHLVGHPAFVLRAPGPSAPPSGDAQVRTVTTAVELQAFEQVVLDGYPVGPAADGGPTFAPSLLDSPVRLRLAYLDGRPVASGASHIAHGVVNLGLAATIPAARRRGAWADVVASRVADDPALPAVAFTSDDSRPGFERMGFLPITRFTLWARRTAT
jgi:hypothetical protein